MLAVARSVGAATGFEEEGVHAIGHDLVFAVGELAIGVEAFEFGGDDFGAGIAVLLEAEVFFGQTGEGIDDARISATICRWSFSRGPDRPPATFLPTLRVEPMGRSWWLCFVGPITWAVRGVRTGAITHWKNPCVTPYAALP